MSGVGVFQPGTSRAATSLLKLTSELIVTTTNLPNGAVTNVAYSDHSDGQWRTAAVQLGDYRRGVAARIVAQVVQRRDHRNADGGGNLQFYRAVPLMRRYRPPPRP
jgi:hypothetical protein